MWRNTDLGLDSPGVLVWLGVLDMICKGKKGSPELDGLMCVFAKNFCIGSLDHSAPLDLLSRRTDKRTDKHAHASFKESYTLP